MKESQVVFDLMADLPPISKEDSPEALASYVLSHFEGTGDIINYSAIPNTMRGAPLRFKSKKRKSKKAVSEVEEEAEIKRKKQKKEKKAPKLVVTE